MKDLDPPILGIKKKGRISGTECRIDLKPGCKFKFFCCLVIYLKINGAKQSRHHARIQHLPPEVVFHQRSSSPGGCLSPKVVFHSRSSSTAGRLPQQVVFHRRLSSTEGRLPSKFAIPPKVVFYRRSSSTEDCLPPKVVFK